MTAPPENPDTEPAPALTRAGWFLLLLVATPFTLCLISNCGGILHIPLMLPFGWIGFLRRVVPEMTMDWAGVGMTALCLLLLVGVIQLLGRTVARPSNSATWPWAKSALLASAVVVIFWAGLSVIGLTTAVQRLGNVKVWTTSGRYSAARTQSQNNLKQMGLAVHMYCDQHKQLPPGGTFDADGRALHGWETSLLPYIEQGALYKQIRLDLPWRHPDNRAAFATEVFIFRSPYLDTARSADGWALTHYAGNVHLLGGRPLELRDITDGTSSTLLIGETAAEFTPWGKPFNVRDPGFGINRAGNGFGGPDPAAKGANFAFSDGSVRLVSENIEPRVLKALATLAGGEVVRDDDW